MCNSISLGPAEKKFFENNLGQQEQSVHLIKREFSGSALSGLSGVVFRHGFLPSFFLLVSKSQRNKGIGQRLMRSVLQEWGRKPLFLTVPKSNAPAIHIYRKFGFFELIPWRKIRGQEMVLMARFF